MLASSEFASENKVVQNSGQLVDKLSVRKVGNFLVLGLTRMGERGILPPSPHRRLIRKGQKLGEPLERSTNTRRSRDDRRRY